MNSQPDKEPSLLALGHFLRDRSYHFVTPTPMTIARVNARPKNETARDLAGAFGWNRPFPATLIEPALLEQLQRSELLAPHARGWLSRVRASTLGGKLYFHSAFPTEAADSVFFGPDSYRFARLIEQEMGAFATMPETILDLGCGSGVGGLHAASLVGRQCTLTLSDINPAAIAMARVNAALAGRTATAVISDLFANLDGHFDLILANPPYMMDAKRRAYRDGGDRQGAGLSLRIVADSLPRLSKGGRLLLYTGVAIRDGKDAFHAAVTPLITSGDFAYRYTEIDPDVFGEELDQPLYQAVERIAVVALIVSRLP